MRLVALITGVLLACAVASICRAADYPAATGYVSDFSGMLPASDRQTLESRLRVYEETTSNEVAIAIVPSLQGQSVDEYARGLFASWGVGKKRQNNGVLFLWAPTERKVRIQVGYGLQSTLTEAVSADILRQVTALFRQEEYAEGVNAAVDGILSRLGNTPPTPGPQDQPANVPEPAHAPDYGSFIIVGVVVAAGIVFGMKYHHDHNLRLARETPLALDRSRQLIEQAATDYTQGLTDAAALRQEAPKEVWNDFEAPLGAARANLEGLREELRVMQAQPREEYRQLREVSRALNRWQERLLGTIGVFEDIRATLQAFRDSRTQAMELLGSLSGSLAGFAYRVPVAAGADQAEKLLLAAQETYANAKAASAERPANWLMVHDLLMDVQACLEQLDGLLNPEAARRTGSPAFARRWPGSDQVSAAAMAFLLTQSMWDNSSSGYAGVDSGNVPDSSSGGSDFGGFGGGDSGGGGASDSY